MESVDRCRGNMREDTCESLQLMLLKKQLYVKGEGKSCARMVVRNRYVEEGIIFPLFFSSDLATV